MSDIYLNRYIKRNDPYISKILLPNSRVWDFKMLQAAKKRSWHSRPYEYKFVFDQIESFIKKNDTCKKVTLIDLACGAGHPGYALFSKLDQIRYIYAVDLDEDLLNNSIDFPNVEKVICDVAELKFEDKSIDVICCVSALEHMSEWEKVLKEIYRILKPFGRAILTFDISTNPSITMKHLIDGKTPLDIKESALSAGFNLVGKFDDSMENAVDMINSEFAMYNHESEFLKGQHNALKAFRMVLEK